MSILLFRIHAYIFMRIYFLNLYFYNKLIIILQESVLI